MAKPPTGRDASPPTSRRFGKASGAERQALRELAEVEKAMAALDGRTVEDAAGLVAARRDAERRRAELQAVVERSRARMKGRTLRLALGVLFGGALAAGLGYAGWLAYPHVRAEVDQHAELGALADRAVAPFLAARLTQHESSQGPATVVVSGGKDRCFVAVAVSTKGPARVRVQRGYARAEGDGSAAFCTCSAEEVRVTPVGPEPLELRVLTAPARVAGGADLLATMHPPPGAVVPESADRACAERAVDGWLDGRPATAPPGGATGDEEKRLEAAGFVPVAFVAPDRPLAVLPEAKETCWIARPHDAKAALSLRLPGGDRPLEGKKSGLAFCAADGRNLTVWRAGDGAASVLAIAADRVGGLLGLRDAAARAGIPVATWTPVADLATDARNALLGSGISVVQVLPETALSEASLFSFSTDARSLASLGPDDAGVSCRPALAVGAVQSLCLLTSPGAWKPLEGLPAATVIASRPTWLPRGGAADVAYVEKALDVLAFARTMTLAGFQLTAHVGLVETAEGAEISGRSGEKEAVALAVSPAPPYVHTLSDGKPWSLDRDPRVVPLAPEQKVRLAASPRFAGARGQRALLAFRR